MKILLSLLSLFIFILISCNNKQPEKIIISPNKISKKTELIILNKSISRNDSILIEFRSNEPYNFIITENKLIDLMQNDDEYFLNNLALLYTNQQGEILNEVKIKEEDLDKKNKLFFEYNCKRQNKNFDSILSFTLNNSVKQFKFKIENELFKKNKHNEKIYLQIRYISNLNYLRYCFNNSLNKLFNNNDIIYFDGELLSNKVLINN